MTICRIINGDVWQWEARHAVILTGMRKQSAGILAYRVKEHLIEVLLVHPGGPYFAKKDIGAWSIPKGEFTNENALDVAIREFKEELGLDIVATFLELKPIVQKGGKIVYAWAAEADINVSDFRSNTFEIEWPPNSGKFREFPEIDKAQWFEVSVAKVKINAGQVALIDELMDTLDNYSAD